MPIFPEVRLPHLEAVGVPPLTRVRLRQPQNAALDDPITAVIAALETQSARFDLGRAAEVAVVVGSRGIADIDKVARAAVDWLKGRALSPFIVPGMGSHGGGTADGQRAILAALGVSGEAMGCEVRATMQTVNYGMLPDGTACHFDAHAAQAAGILVINRIKAHTSFPRPVESGLSKMLAVGLGKAEGARQVHKQGARGLAEVLPALATRILAAAPITAGLALVENADHQLMHIEAVAPGDFAAADTRLLQVSKNAMARLPFKQLDGLIIERLGKDISGAGIDPAISGRTDIRGVDNPSEPFIHKITVLDITPASNGNAIGIGICDFIPRHMAERLNLQAMYMNAVSATFLEKAFIPIVLPDDETCVKAVVATCWATDAPRLCHIDSSAVLDRIAVSEPLLDDLRTRDLILEEEDTAALQFDGEGRLTSRLGS